MKKKKKKILRLLFNLFIKINFYQSREGYFIIIIIIIIIINIYVCVYTIFEIYVSFKMYSGCLLPHSPIMKNIFPR